MEITHYFLHFMHGTIAKNNLQKEVNDYLCSLDGTIFDASMIVQVQVAITTKISELNNKNKRCTALVSGWYKDPAGYVLNGVECASFYIRPGQLVKFFTP